MDNKINETEPIAIDSAISEQETVDHRIVDEVDRIEQLVLDLLSEYTQVVGAPVGMSIKQAREGVVQVNNACAKAITVLSTIDQKQTERIKSLTLVCQKLIEIYDVLETEKTISESQRLRL